MTPEVVADALERALAALLPERWREAVLGDLAEVQARTRTRGADDPGARATLARLAALAAIVARWQAEAYRGAENARDRQAAGWIFAAGVGLLLVLHEAAWAGPPPVVDYDPVSRLLLAFWGAPHLVGALAAGLLAGRIPELRIVRGHLAASLAALAALTAPHFAAGLTAAGLCLAAAALGDAARCEARADGRPRPETSRS